jgi:Tfp pilus assembly protein PilF
MAGLRAWLGAAGRWLGRGLVRGVAFAALLVMAVLVVLAQPPAWLGALLLGLPALVVLAGQAQRRRVALPSAWELACRELLVHWPLPALAELEPDAVGVFRSARAERLRAAAGSPASMAAPAWPPYVPRSVDAELAAALRDHRFVLVCGWSRAGKSRTAYEVARRELPRAKVVLPRDRAALRVLATLDPPPWRSAPALLWLDDLERWLGDDGVDARLLADLTTGPAPVTVLATIRLTEEERLRNAPEELDEAAREVLDQATTVLLRSQLDTAEQAAARRRYPGADLAVGIGAHLAAVPELLRRFEEGAGSEPVGHALVRAAVDWRRAGMEGAPAVADLEEVARPYLERLRPGDPPAERELRRGLAWARELVDDTAALLVGSQPAEPLLDRVEQAVHDLGHPGVWDALLARARLDEAVRVGFAAFTRGREDVAERAWRLVVNAAQPETAPRAAVYLGVLRRRRGDVDGARRAFERAVESGHPSLAALAAAQLGDLLALLDEPVAARAAFERALAMGEPAAVPLAALGLGVLLAQQGDVPGAIGALERAAASGQRGVAAEAAANLATLHQQHGDAAAALAAYRRAEQLGYAGALSHGALSLGEELAARGDLASAWEFHGLALASGDPDVVPLALRDLAGLAEGFAAIGDLERAREGFERVAASGDPVAAPVALLGLCDLARKLAERGDVGAALACCEPAIASADPDAAPRALVVAGGLLERQGDAAAARRHYEQAAASAHPDQAPLALLQLARMHAALGDLESAAKAARRAAASGHPDVTPLARQLLATLTVQAPRADAG